MSEADKIDDKEIEEFLKFLKVADEVCKEKGKMYDFKCPLCSGNAKAIKNTYNGHLWSKCENCDINVIQ